MAARRSAFVVSAVPQVCEPQPESTCPLLPPPPVRIWYEVVGRGPVHVLFVPGMCVSRRMWDAQVQELSKYPETYSLCLLDNRGTGDSDIPAAGWLDSRNANYSIETLARDAWTVADDVFGPTSSIHVIGWSMGSMIAQRIALLHLDRVASLALLSGHAGGWLWNNVPSIELAGACIDLMRSGFDLDRSVEISLRLHYTDSFLAEMVIDEETGEKVFRREKFTARYRHGIQRDSARDVNGSVFWGHLTAVRSHDLSREEANALRDAPFETVVIYGKEDRVVTPCASRDLARRIGAKLHEVPGSHFIIEEASREVNSHLTCLWKTSIERRNTDERPLDSYIVRSLVHLSLSFA